MFCGNCGKNLQDGERFCPYCGTPVELDHGEHDDNYGVRQTTKSDSDYQEIGADYGSDVTTGMGYGYRQNAPDGYSGYQPEQMNNMSSKFPTETPPTVPKRDRFEEEWEREEKKEKITFIILGVVIVVLVIAIVFGVVALVRSGEDQSTGNVAKLNEEMKEEMEQSQNREAAFEEFEEELEEEAISEEETPEITQEATPEPTQEVTPEPTIVVTPEPTQAAVQEKSNDYIISDSSTRYLTNSDLSNLSEWEIRVARNEIYARHGRIFDTKELAEYFEGKSWYNPTIPADQFSNSYLNTIEKENLKFILNYEKAHNLNQ